MWRGCCVWDLLFVVDEDRALVGLWRMERVICGSFSNVGDGGVMMMGA